MKISIDPVVASRINSAWSRMTPDQQGRIAQSILNANQQAVSVSQTGRAPSAPAAPHHLMLAHSALTNDSDNVVNSLAAGVVLDVGPDGVIWGTGKYQQFDPGWVEAFAVFLETAIFGSINPFVESPPTIQIPDSVTIALAGDWGTGDWRTASNPAPSTDVGNHMAFLKPQLTIHLGDVYYSGTGDEELHELVKLWPKGSIGSLSLNSNHEMYSGAKPYFQAIANPPFEIQKGCSFFALENSNWVIVGMDSAYYADDDNLYMDGALFPPDHPNVQNSFLLEIGAKAQLDRKKLILLTHHNGLDETGSQTAMLWDQVMNAFPAGGGPSYWYWGHVHAAVVYQNQDPGGRNVACRCCGHGGLPWGHATELDNNPNVLWYEKRPANDPDIPERVFNGFAMLSLAGPNIQEVFYDENGGVAWRVP
ncbi:MAG TPA: metallophosphoesterase [Bryobacteraceae bacterium]|nr:metallophosphoesterase [Bryobacteraceae bacterium]